MSSVKRADITPEAATFVERLQKAHGPLLFHQSGGCCDGSAPMCYPLGDFRIGANDVLLGMVAGCPFYIGGQQFEYWRHTHLTIDIVAGRGSGFSIEAPEGRRFITRSRLFTDEENKQLQEAGEPLRGAQATT